MPDEGLTVFRQFSGSISLDHRETPLKFSARVTDSGEIEFEFKTLTICKLTEFIYSEWDADRRTLRCFKLVGESDDGVKFHTDNLSFSSMQSRFTSDGERSMTPVGSCLAARFVRDLATPVELPSILMRVKGFQNFHQLRNESPLGTITMDGASEIGNPDQLTGILQIRATAAPLDYTKWREAVDALFEHIRRVMSFASAVVLRSPIFEYFNGNEVEVVAWSQSMQVRASMRTMHYLDQHPIFEAAVNSYFAPPILVKNLFYAIEWFAMDASYNEVRLVNSMTVLENLVASNLGEVDELILEKKKFKKTRSVLRSVIRSCIQKWDACEVATADEVVAELDERLGDLNRRSIFKKMMILVDRWSVPMDGIEESQLKAAKRARDLIVHMGSYGPDKSDELWDHVTIIRELVVRFLLTAIGFKGSYISFVGGMHHTVFPPVKQIDVTVPEKC
jgi:hypothetical protein